MMHQRHFDDLDRDRQTETADEFQPGRTLAVEAVAAAVVD